MKLSLRAPAVVLGCLVALCVACGAAARPAPGSPVQEGPSLIVLVVVDQLRGDLIDHYAEAFTGGFRRLREEGFSYIQASHNHAVTETAAGHATLGTGVPPSRHGIVANDFRVPIDGGGFSVIYAVEDTTSPLLGFPDYEGRSPANVVRPGLADWVLAASPEARVVTASKKDRSAIGIGGKNPDAQVYWIADGTGRFVTSAYYADRYPAWVDRFNAGPMAELYADTAWTSVVPAEMAWLAGPDTASWEGDGIHTAFPHLASQEAPEGEWGHFLWVDQTPIPDEAVLRFGLTAVDELDLGQRGVTDYLGLSFSQTDYVGHDYGPFSQEALDNLIRLDERLGRLFKALDREVGRGRWSLALSADHGVLTTPEQLVERGESGHRLARTELQEVLGQVRAAVDEGGADAAVRERIVTRLEAMPLIRKVYRSERLEAEARTDSIAALFVRSSYPDRFPGLLSHLGFEILWEPGTLGTVMTTGTSHVGPYWTDRWVPMMYLGAGVRHGESAEAVYTWDVAPTLAALGGVATPGDVQGHRLIPPL